MMVCSVEGCNGVFYARGWCRKHYARWRRHGSPLVTLFNRAEDGAPQEFIEMAIKYQGDDCLIWPFARSNGHAIHDVNDRKSTRVSRYICETVYGPPPTAKHETCHNCGKGHLGCVNPHHLRWDTHVGNEADKIIHGTHNKGERHNMAKLTWEKVRAIRAMQGKLSGHKVAAIYGVNNVTIYDIWSGKKWKE